MTRSKDPSSPSATTVFIKNMVCDRCIRVVKEELEGAGYEVTSVSLGEATLSSTSLVDLKQIAALLQRNGFELIEDRNAHLIEKAKTSIIARIRKGKEGARRPEPYSRYLSRVLGVDYPKLSQLFSSVENVTIEHFVILQRIEFAKELLKYGELTLSEIAFRLGYSSVQHLSNQFRSVTGLTPSYFRKSRRGGRRPIDHLI